MIVFFVSECEKKARKRTSQILDCFAERIGQSTWKSRLTMEGLKSVKLLLSRNASRHTAVTCHRVVGRTNTKVLWIIGNRKKFSPSGVIPTNYTANDSIKQIDNDWYYLELIKICVALAALFHDWGKAWDAFQNLLRNRDHADHIRHEYVSLLLWASLIQDRKPQEWLGDLKRPDDLNEQALAQRAGSYLEKGAYPFKDLKDPFSFLIGWLIVSHHSVPHPNYGYMSACKNPHELMQLVDQEWGFTKSQIESGLILSFSRGLPSRSPSWCKQIAKWARRGEDFLLEKNFTQAEWNEVIRPIAMLARTALMIGDHESSRKDDQNSNESSHKASQTDTNNKWEDSLWAKSVKNSMSPVLLDTHLIDVTREALSFCHLYPYLEKKLGVVQSPAAIEKRSKANFTWQDRAADGIRKRSNETGKGRKGIFCLNMASTGTGKTFANAKIMNAIQAGRLRYTLALGLRSLTLQTGNEYRNRIGLDNSELAVVIGSKAYKDLQEVDDGKRDRDEDADSRWEVYSDWEEIVYSSSVLDEKLSTKLGTNKARQILYSPVLVCTIDHVMGATEGVKKGRHILPWLRMLSSDLVIDEVDDFDGSDLVAILRLVHLSGMLGRNVLLSSATIPPSVAESAFNSYFNGWQAFSRTRDRDKDVLCAWVDETIGTRVKPLQNILDFRSEHDEFTNLRVKRMRRKPVRRRGEIRPVQSNDFAGQVLASALDLHDRHADLYGDRKVSFGVVRMANISPCVQMARYLLNTPLPPDVAIRVLTYHSRFPRISRHYMEKELDSVLKRMESRNVFEHPTIREHLKQTAKKNVLFIVVATPVEEVGRDHDFDWAVLEPSSIRSLIQMAGRVMRHREIEGLDSANIIILNHNVRALLNEGGVAYTRPGYESEHFKLKSHDMRDLIDESQILERIDSGLRIGRIEQPEPENSLVDLEHVSLQCLLTEGEITDYTKVPGWIHGPYYLTDVAQRAKPFRSGTREEKYYLFPEDFNRLKFYTKDDLGRFISADQYFKHANLGRKEKARLWLPVTYYYQLEDIGSEMGITVDEAAGRFGEMTVPDYMLEAGQANIQFNPDLGLWQEKNLKELFG